MDVPPQIAFRNVEPTDALKRLIRGRIQDLEKLHGRLVSCQVTVENTTPGRASGEVHRVHLEVGLPHRRPLVVDHEPSIPEKAHGLDLLIGEAFDIAERRVREARRRQAGEVKSHPLPPHGRIVEVIDDEGAGYGFILTADGRRVYFHEHALVGLAFEDLEIGMEVRFTEAAGREGPQASGVVAIDDRRVGRRQRTTIPLGSGGTPG